MYSILLDVSSKHILSITFLMLLPIYQQQAEPIFFTVLTSVQHTSFIFDLVKKRIPSLLTYLPKDKGLHQRLVDTVKALIEHFNTFPVHEDYSDLVSYFVNGTKQFCNFTLIFVTCFRSIL